MSENKRPSRVKYTVPTNHECVINKRKIYGQWKFYVRHQYEKIYGPKIILDFKSGIYTVQISGVTLKLGLESDPN